MNIYLLPKNKQIKIFIFNTSHRYFTDAVQRLLLWNDVSEKLTSFQNTGKVGKVNKPVNTARNLKAETKLVVSKLVSHIKSHHIKSRYNVFIHTLL